MLGDLNIACMSLLKISKNVNWLSYKTLSKLTALPSKLERIYLSSISGMISGCKLADLDGLKQHKVFNYEVKVHCYKFPMAKIFVQLSFQTKNRFKISFKSS